ncbi:hypothetical protein ACG59Z_16325 [Acinetobacter sp. ABJ_C1_1]|uniref:hypothetical protein n=1 Tax=Acinetobacter sp. ABJ_C1_1 TaxID=3378321 RepID=UPI0037DC6520
MSKRRIKNKRKNNPKKQNKVSLQTQAEMKLEVLKIYSNVFRLLAHSFSGFKFVDWIKNLIKEYF